MYLEQFPPGYDKDKDKAMDEQQQGRQGDTGQYTGADRRAVDFRLIAYLGTAFGVLMPIVTLGQLMIGLSTRIVTLEIKLSYLEQQLNELRTIQKR